VVSFWEEKRTAASYAHSSGEQGTVPQALHGSVRQPYVYVCQSCGLGFDAGETLRTCNTTTEPRVMILSNP